MSEKDERPRGRGTCSNPRNRYHQQYHESEADGWVPDEVPAPRTNVTIESVRTAITCNDSPDIPFDRAINPYRGCEHGCIYCYARPGHAWLDLSPGLDFETRLIARPDLPQRLRENLSARNYRPAPLSIGSMTDVYQPIERSRKLTRALLEILLECRHPFMITTKSSLIERDLDLLAEAADLGIASVGITLTSLQDDVARALEPRATSPARRLRTIARLTQAGVPVLLMVSPVIPVLTDHELERILRAGREAGARGASHALLRLPQEVQDLFRQWLRSEFPDMAGHVWSRLCEMQENSGKGSRFGVRMTGQGVFAQLLAQRFELAWRRLGFEHPRPLRQDRFRPPSRHGQLSLF